MSPPPFRTVEISDPRFESGGLRQITVKSRSLRGRGDLTLFVPSGAEETRDLPLAILLHGVYGSHWAWTLSGGVHRTAQRLTDAGEIAPLAIVMPSDGLWGDGSGYVRHADGSDFEKWIVEEVPLAATLGAPGLITGRSPLFIAGLSMGGFGALRIGAKYPDRFRAIAGHSSITNLDQLAQFIEEPLSNCGAADADESVLDTMLANRGRLPPIRFDCGVDDQLIEHNCALHRALDEHGVTHVYEEFPGGHEWPYWEEHIARTLRFFSATLHPIAAT
jgi:putative tributyrin esterase